MRPSSAASSAVMRDPESRAASTTTVAQDKAAITRFLSGK